MMTSVICERNGKAGCVQFDLSNSEGALPIQALLEIFQTLSNWAKDPDVEFILFESSREAEGIFLGGDALPLLEASRSIDIQALSYIQSAYRLCQAIAHFPKPVLTLLGGRSRLFNSGVALNSLFRIASEKTTLGFPETGFGFIPDGGASLYLSRLPDGIGAWLALTGAKLRGEEVLAAGLATHFCHASELRALRQALSKSGLKVLKEFQKSNASGTIKNRAEIETLFAGDCANTIKKNLENGSDWAKRQATKFSAKSPIATKVALRQLRTARYFSSVNEALRIDYRIASRLVFTRAFREGVRAQFVDRDFCPWWRPQVVNGVTFDMVASFFSPLEDGELELPSWKSAAPLEALMVAA